MEKWIELELEKQVDRYHITGITVDEFIDILVKDQKGGIRKLRDITKSQFDSHPNKEYLLELDVEGKFQVEHYISKHESEESERLWNEFILDKQ